MSSLDRCSGSPRPCRIVAAVSVMVWLGIACTPDRSPESKPDSAHRPSVRIVALAPNAAEIICGLGACDRLVGVSSFCTYPPELAHVPKIGGLRDPDLELILSLEPDLLVLRGHGSGSEPLRQLARAAGTAIYDDPVETLDDLYRTITDLGRLLGRTDQAAAMVHQVRSELANIAARVADRPRTKVFFTMRSPALLANVLTVGRDSFVNELIEIAGGKNIFGDQTIRYPMVSLEEIVGRDPEIIIESMAGERMDARRRAILLDQWRALGPIQAIRDNRVHFVTDGHLTVPSQRVTLAARTLLSLIHPEVDAGE